MPKVSVIIPVYNTEKYLRECLDSVVNQTLKDIEIICVDDGSTDNSLSILKEYAENDDRFIVLEQQNQGPAIARENGINHASGVYIGFMDSDDFIDKKYYELLYKTAKRYDSDIAMTDNVLLYDNKVIEKKKCGVSSKDKLITTIEEKSNITITSGICWNKIYRKSFINKNNLLYIGSHPGEDNIFNATTIIKANKIAVNHDAKYYYVQVSDSIVHKLKNRKSFSIFSNYEYIDNWIESQQNLTFVEKRYWQYVNSKRKKQDFKGFYDTMSEEYKEEFLELVNQNIKIKDLIVSLTSYPARINTVNQTIESLLNQTVKAEKIILWLAPEQFPNREKDLPQQLLDLIPKGLTIDWCEDIKSYKKLIPTFRKYRNAIIVTADDDLLYKKNWLSILYQAYLKNPDCIHSHRAHYITFEHKKILPYIKWMQNIKKVKPSFNNFCTSGAGVLYPPNCFYKDMLREDLFMQLCPQADDIWFWTMCVLNNKKINVVAEGQELNCIEGTQDTALWLSNVEGGQNDIQLQNVINYYPLLLKKLNKRNSGFYKNEYEKIFSVKNKNIHKVVTVFGLKFKIKSKKLIQKQRIDNIEKDFRKYKDAVSQKILMQNEAIKDLQHVVDNSKNQITSLQNKINNLTKQFNYKLSKYMPEEKYSEFLKDWYFEKTGEFLNLDNPQTFNEKIQWVKLNDSTPLKTRLADKYLVRYWVKEKIGEEYLIPLLGVWDNFDEIDFDKLPDKFVLKCNHGCGYNIIVEDKSKLNIDDARKKINMWLNEDYAFVGGLELQYSNIPRKIIAEEYIEELANGNCCDYAIHCFNGEPRLLYHTNFKGLNASHRAWSFYDKDFNLLPIYHSRFKKAAIIDSDNKNINKVFELAKILCKEFYFVRVYIFCTKDKIYFGEMTFTPTSGVGRYEPESWNLEFGQMLKLPTEIDEKSLIIR